MRLKINDTQLKLLESKIQDFINSSLSMLREESQEWGLGEMTELRILDNIKKIQVVEINVQKKIKVFVDVFIKNKEDLEDSFSEYEGMVMEIESRVISWLPIILIVNDIK